MGLIQVNRERKPFRRQRKQYVQMCRGVGGILVQVEEHWDIKRRSINEGPDIPCQEMWISFPKAPFVSFLLYTIISLGSTTAKNLLTVLLLSTFLAFFFFPSTVGRGGVPCYRVGHISPPNPSMACVAHQITLISCNLCFCQTHPVDQACDNHLPIWVVSSSRPESMAHTSWYI